VALLLATACSAGQDPGVPTTVGQGGPTTTSHLLGRCPSGGPDTTTPPEGCLDEQGVVVQP
jgi:hypothetical protein